MFSTRVNATLRNSTLELEREIVGCFLADRKIRLKLRKTQKPKVERRMLGQLAQSALE